VNLLLKMEVAGYSETSVDICQTMFVTFRTTLIFRQHIYNEFEILTAVTVKNISCDITQCSHLEVYRRFGGTYYLYLQGGRLS
jgi:hypothetical protein